MEPGLLCLRYQSHVESEVFRPGYLMRRERSGEAMEKDERCHSNRWRINRTLAFVKYFRVIICVRIVKILKFSTGGSSVVKITRSSALYRRQPPGGVLISTPTAYIRAVGERPGRQPLELAAREVYELQLFIRVEMGFDIPEPYCWDESFRVFVSLFSSIDRMIFYRTRNR